MGIMHHPSDLDTRHFDSSTSALEMKYNGTIETIRQSLQVIPDREALAQYMNAPATYKCPRNRNKQVNFLSITRGEAFATTVEFRQARGSLCPDEISQWIDFCIGLIKLAALYRENPGRFPAKGLGEYLDDNGKLQKGIISVFDLMHDMELGNEAVQYWELRMAKYAMGTKGDADDRTDNELPPPEPDLSDSEDAGAVYG